MRDMNLTPEQMERLQTIRTEQKAEIEKTRDALHQAHEEMRDLIGSEVDEATIREKYRQVSSLRQEMADLRFNSMMEMRKTFTLEQRRQFVEKMKERHSHFGDRRDRGNRGGFRDHHSGQSKPAGPPPDEAF